MVEEPETTEEMKMLRTRMWLDDLASCSARLREIQCRITELNMMQDGMRGQRYDAQAGGAFARPDKVGRLVVNRLEALQVLETQAAELTTIVSNAARIIAKARSEDGGNQREYLFLLARYARGDDHDTAAHKAGLDRWAAKGAARKVACSLYAAAPEVFGNITVGEVMPFGYDKF